MFSVNNFYNYLNHYCNDNKLKTEMRSFHVHGSRLLKDIIIPSFEIDPLIPNNLYSRLVMFDQEPIQFEYINNWINFKPKSFPNNYEYNITGNLYKNLSPTEFIFRHFSSVYNPILMHSEKNSSEVSLFKNNHFQTVYHFYHGFIARDWFRHWKHYNMKSSPASKRFGMYCRDATSSREYRLELLEKLIPFKEDLYYNLQDPIYDINPQLNIHYKSSDDQYSSDASAIIVPEDCQKFDIQIVPETLFRTQKTHLTEKVFKPIVMEQPFIIVGCPNSLEYLQSYGFKTFSEFWNESYDSITDPAQRLEAIMKVIKQISELSSTDYKNMLTNINTVVLYNKHHFFSEKFEQSMLTELHVNINNAVAARNEQFESMLGGTWFMYLDKLHQAGHDITDFNRDRIKHIIKHTLTTSPLVGRRLVQKFKHLY